ncbi:MAG: ShlB/FhaC/HecB family hemolysin secretion/activation protein [Leptotrichiaceae bacterium]|nr:ShlB/FhaC/HecB family hemolysin secretion/activation protein [Leptotrichiaceae bacterium]
MKKKRVCIFLFLCAGVLNGTPKSDAQKILDRQQQQIEKERHFIEQERRQKEIETTRFIESETQTISDIPENTVTFLLTDLEIKDSDKLLSSGDKFQLVSKYRYSEIGIKELNILVNEANALLVKRGFVTSRVSADTDNIKEGKIILQVITGKIDKIKLNHNRFGDKLKIFFNKPVTEKNILNIKDIDTMTDNFNKNSSNSFAVNIEPSNKEGYSNIVAKNEVKGKTTVSVGYNNHGDEQGGKNRAKIALDIESPLGINDLLSMNIQGVKRKKVNRDWKIPEASLLPGQIAPNGPFTGYDPNMHGLLPPQRNTLLWNIIYRVPLRSYSLTLSGNKSVYRRSTYAYNTIYDLSGSSTAITANLSKIIYRDNRNKLIGNIEIKRKNSKSYFEDVELTDRNLTIGTIGLNYDTVLFKGISGLGISYSKGLRIFHGERDAEKGEKSPKSEAERMNFNFYWYKPMKNLTFRLTAEAQISKNVNYGSEKMTLGGIGSVPGYKYDNISGDRGYSLLSELSYIFRYKNQRLIPYISYGIGETKNNKDNSEYKFGKVKGGSIGLRYSSTYFDIDVSYARPFSQSKYVKPKNHEVYASMIMKYSF